ncbi:MAG: glycosyltransferase family 2 protein [Phycisphaeraceae bacterium]|nr:glycosyltransferase family 2 protein [Phycisphaerales bacterium]MCB9859954.1 glycosyltransferase family 2 protein [Phycisphaeraceae bacterium]
MKLAVVIPVYNERDTVAALVARVQEVLPPYEPQRIQSDPDAPAIRTRIQRMIVLVDDASVDGTSNIIDTLGEQKDVHVRRHTRNQGKGAALRTGFIAALELGADVAIVQDADLEYDPAEHEIVLAPILQGKADAVIGSRFIGGTHRVLYYWHAVGNRVITTFSNMLTNLNLTDVECCFKAFSRDVLTLLDTQENRFGIEPEFVAKLARMRLPTALQDDLPDTPQVVRDAKSLQTRHARIFEVPVSYAGRTYAEGKKITWRDGFRAMWCIVKYNMFR